jgi:hypothetical protein
MGAVLLIAFGGVLAGGAYSLHRQGVPRPVVIGTGIAAVLAIVAGVLWQV